LHRAKFRQGATNFNEFHVLASLPVLQRRNGPWFIPLNDAVQEGQHPLTGQRAANFRLMANQ